MLSRNGNWQSKISHSISENEALFTSTQQRRKYCYRKIPQVNEQNMTEYDHGLLTHLGNIDPAARGQPSHTHYHQRSMKVDAS